MAGMRDIKRRIKSVQSTQKITKAMKMVSAAKLRKSQEKVNMARAYTTKLVEVTGRLLEASSLEHPLLKNSFDESKGKKKVAFVVLTGDRGLCGGYNANIVRLTEQTAKNLSDKEEAVLITIGKKGRDYLRKRENPVIREYIDLGDEPNYIQARELAKEIAEMYTSGQVHEVRLVYTRFYSAIRHNPVVEQLLPLTGEQTKENNQHEIDYIYEPEQEALLASLLPRYYENLVYHALVEGKASEHGARMTAMESASDNAAEIIQKLLLSFNRARQAAITNEISEIVAGASALG
jgi:F-type H+-transporting ATPase subunit gamma